MPQPICCLKRSESWDTPTDTPLATQQPPHIQTTRHVIQSKFRHFTYSTFSIVMFILYLGEHNTEFMIHIINSIYSQDTICNGLNATLDVLYTDEYHGDIIDIDLLTSSAASSSYSSIGTTARCGLWPVAQHPFFFWSITLSPSSHSQHLKISFYALFPYFPGSSPSSRTLPVLVWRSFWASYPPPFSPGDLTNLSFAILFIVLYFLLCSSLLALNSYHFSIPHFHI